MARKKLHQRRQDPPIGWVYFVHARRSNLIKIGYTGRAPRERLAGMQVFSPERLVCLGVIPGTRATERKLHEKLAHRRSHGEWFRPTRGLWRFIRRRAEPMPTPKPRNYAYWCEDFANHFDLSGPIQRAHRIVGRPYCRVCKGNVQLRAMTLPYPRLEFLPGVPPLPPIVPRYPEDWPA